MADKSKRVWTFLVYPESVKENWIEELDNQCIPFVVSPLHEFDVNDSGELKKPHYHVVLIFEGKKTYSTILDITKSIEATVPFPVLDTRKMIRYLVHIDNKEKYQYDPKTIVNHAGIDLSKFFLPTQDECLHIVADIMRFIEEHQILEFSSLESYIRECRYDEWYYTFKCERNFFDMKIRSLRNGCKNIGKINANVIS